MTFNVLMRGFCQNNEMQKVVELLQEMAERKFSPDESTIGIVIDLLSKDEKCHKYLKLLPTFPSQGQTKRI